MKRVFYCIILLLMYSRVHAQNKAIDSLLACLPRLKEDTNKVQTLQSISWAYRSVNPQQGISYGEQALALAVKLSWKKGEARAYNALGANYDNRGDYPRAIEHYLKALKIQEEIGNKGGIAATTGNIGGVYYSQSDYVRALEYHLKALKIKEEIGDKYGISATTGNIGGVYYSLEDYARALEYFLKALKIKEEIGDKAGIARTTVNIGLVYHDQGNYVRALEYYFKALKIDEETGNKYGMAGTAVNIGLVYIKLNRAGEAKSWLEKALKLSYETGAKESVKSSYSGLAAADSALGNYKGAFENHKMYMLYRDSIYNEENTRKQTQMEMQYVFDKKEAELTYGKQLSDEKVLRQEKELQLSQKESGMRQQALALSNKEKDLQRLAYLKEKAELEKQKTEKEKQLSLSEKEKELQNAKLITVEKERDLQASELEVKKTQRNLFIAGTVLFLLLATSVFIGLTRTSKEKKKSEALLLNILPAEVADELKEKGSAQAKQFDDVTVLFTDFVGFTTLSEQLSPTELVQEIHKNFTAFDAIMEKHSLEKIKTIGDAYLAVCGLPKESETHAQRVVRAAIEIRDYMAVYGGKFRIRIGIHSGSVVAGIVGVKKYAYDIWGDTVNTAARMEQNSEPGKINISAATYELIKDEFACEHRGKIKAKNKGEVDMYFVKEISP